MATALAAKGGLAVQAGKRNGTAAYALTHQNDQPSTRNKAITRCNAESSGIATVKRACKLTACRDAPVCAPAVTLERGQHLLPPRAQRAGQISPPHPLLL